MKLKTDMREVFNRAREVFNRARLSSAEIVFLSSAILFACAVALFYSYKVAPLSFTIAARQRQIQDLKSRIEKLNNEEKKRLDQASNAEKILESLRGFDSRLYQDGRGMTQIINEINALGVTHKVLVEESRYDMEEADKSQLDENGNPKPQLIKDKKPKIYPNLGIETTVVGDYPNLRQFLSNLERSKQFLIVNSLSFQGGDERTVRQLARSGKQPQLGSSDSPPVTLKIGLDTYFHPPSVGVATAQSKPAAPKNGP
jgi:hypothetical protein